MLKRLLVGVAGTPATASKIAHTIELARHHGATVTLLSVIDVDRLARVGSVPLGAGHYANKMRRERAAAVNANADAAIVQFADACRDARVEVQVLRHEAEPFATLAAVWRYHDLCILGLRGWFGSGIVPEPEHALLDLIVRGIRPILAVSESRRVIRKVLIGYNGSMESAKTMKRFCQLALWPDMEFHIAAVEGSTKEPTASLLADAANYCRAWGHRCDTALLTGAPSTALMSYAGQIDADLIAIGSSYNRILIKNVFGPNALEIAKTADRPVFLSH